MATATMVTQVVAKLLRRKPRLRSYRGRARWCDEGGLWHLHFDPEIEIAGAVDGMQASFPVEPPPPEGAQEFAVEFEFQEPARRFPWVWVRIAFALLLLAEALFIFFKVIL